MHSLAPGDRIALTHDYLDQYGGAERTILEICGRFPSAPLFVSVYDRDVMGRLGFPAPTRDVKVSFLQRLPLRRRVPRYYLTCLYPLAFRSFDLRPFDIVLSSATFAAKAVTLRNDALHVCYCYTPPRFLWGFDSDTAARSMPLHERPLAAAARVVLREIDRRAAQRVDIFVAVSRVVATRIATAYGRSAVVVHPPVDVARFRSRPRSDGRYFLVVSRLNAYKHIDHVVTACTRAGLPLVVVGRGPHEAALRRIAGPTVRFTGPLPDADVCELMASCRAFVLPGEEDFGIAAVEAMAAGAPVIALGRGGALETVVDGVTGMLYGEPTAAAFLDAVGELEGRRWDADACRSRASLFDRAHFGGAIGAAVSMAAANGRLN